MKVRVKDWGKIYTTYDEWLRNNNCSEYLDNYKQKESFIDHFSYLGDTWYPLDKNNKDIDMANRTYEVLMQNIHGGCNGNVMLCLIQEPITDKVYLIEKSAVKEIRG